MRKTATGRPGSRSPWGAGKFKIPRTRTTRTESSVHKLSALYEMAPEGVNSLLSGGYSAAKNLGRKISKAMRNISYDAKRRQRRGSARQSTGGSAVKQRQAPGINAGPVMTKPRHRKFFGLDKPQIPY